MDEIHDTLYALIQDVQDCDHSQYDAAYYAVFLEALQTAMLRLHRVLRSYKPSKD